MGRAYEHVSEFSTGATPDEVWDAIATGPGIDSWFMGRTEVTPGEGGSVRTTFGDYTPDSPVEVWEPGHRLRYAEVPDADGRFIAYEYLIEGRAHGSTVVRVVTSGFLPGDDWAEEFEAMAAGLSLFHATLAVYLGHFSGRYAVRVTEAEPVVTDWDAAWDALGHALGLDRAPRAGDEVRLETPDGTVGGIVYFTNRDTAGIRTADGLYRFLRGFRSPVLASHHVFRTGAGGEAADAYWNAYLSRVFG